MPTNVWYYRVDLKDVFHNEDMIFEESRDEIVRRLKGSQWVKHSEWETLRFLVDELAEVDCIEYFDDVWDQIYDYADVDRCWIATF